MKKKTLSVVLLLLVGCAPAATSTPVATLPPPAAETPAVSAPTTTPDSTSAPAATPLPEFEELAALFSYDPALSLEPQIDESEPQDDVLVQSLSYQATERCRAEAILVRPASGDGPYPAVIYMHSGGAFMTQYQDEAVLLAGQGVVSLLLDDPFSTGCDHYRSQVRQGYIDTVVWIQRGVDLLETLPQVDAQRIAYVGHSFGATWGGVLAGVEPRIRSFVLMAGYAQVSKNDTPEVPDLDAILYVGHAQNVAFLFQFANNDEYIDPQEAQQYYDAASGAKTIQWYDTSHPGLQVAGQADRLNWLAAQLGFEPPDGQ